ncbi:acetylornithine/succinylornithine family transaminase [Roseobacter sp. HKCCD9010]|uniref:aspartate aminotransferase family protein n=1 Tax=unclassified Roseobacter TaxID=196798 RepID=UPI001492D7F1|nr:MULTISPECIES: aspartate aminotransferase family protein [unclassified Roseobacter]MBF9048902.1 acetylornithine/succinylornithine family transaminase [Rhodobacterales bacterium HKCCD4356]NNV10901.1 acetylornithine/succinylornithine family transaminase [Roseobacter sp. HKCCD7357]NNV15086.1 acetylornithine/succinylornithine family transaminase [Roseobacter sp. HKCCD8768]NNV24545.1 acetylornithine/succinylornithine family transaminase [Roseobacter sp. HKCCD8192]NNV28802.1 acetylornithine/succin
MISPVLPSYSRAPLSFVKGEGAWLVEADGRRFLDFASGIAVMALGHGHPALVNTLKSQAEKLWHTSNLYTVPEQQELAEKLVEHTFADTMFFCNSGTEAGELAVKMARKYWHEKGQPDRTTIITFEGAFHGRSMGMISAAGAEKLTVGFGPLLPGFIHLSFGDHDALREAAARTDVGAIMLEPIQGESGIRPVPDQCLKGLRDLCYEHGLLLIFDEIQCGMGRTGKLFAHEWAGISPDIMMVAKGIGGGFPIGALLATEEAAIGMTPGTHGSTYGGNPLGCAVAATVMDVITEDGFLEDVSRRAGLLRQKAEGLVASHPEVFEEVRGAGFMLGLVCKLPNLDVINAAFEQEMLTVPAGDNVVRLLPSLTLSEAEIAEGIDRLDRAATALKAQTHDAAE